MTGLPDLLAGPGLVALGTVVAIAVGLWLVSLAVRDASIVDPAWGLLFVAMAWAVHVAVHGVPDPGRLLAGEAPAAKEALLGPVLVTVWGGRLALHLARRNLGHGEDYRYVAMRRRWGDRFPLVSLGTVFLLQAALAWVVAWPVQAAAGLPRADGWGPLVAAAGVLAWAAGVAFEAVGDAQLAAFRRDPANRGRVLDRGLWRYTRHPNYFGDALAWWGIGLVGAATGAWWTLAGPALMTLLLVRVSGVAMLERTIGERRPGYADYVRRTSAFLPRPPRD